MKYRLKKDLPFAKAGARVWINDNLVMCEGWGSQDDSITSWIIEYNDRVNKLISEGWIEEVKPREWWVVVDSKGGLSCDGTRMGEAMAKLIAETNNKSPIMDMQPYTAIKVREVIE